MKETYEEVAPLSRAEFVEFNSQEAYRKIDLFSRMERKKFLENLFIMYCICGARMDHRNGFCDSEECEQYLDPFVG